MMFTEHVRRVSRSICLHKIWGSGLSAAEQPFTSTSSQTPKEERCWWFSARKLDLLSFCVFVLVLFTTEPSSFTHRRLCTCVFDLHLQWHQISVKHTNTHTHTFLSSTPYEDETWLWPTQQNFCRTSAELTPHTDPGTARRVYFHDPMCGNWG